MDITKSKTKNQRIGRGKEFRLILQRKDKNWPLKQKKKYNPLTPAPLFSFKKEQRKNLNVNVGEQ